MTKLCLKKEIPSDFEQIPCNLCGADHTSVLYDKPDTRFNPDETFTAVRCRNCGLGFLNPRPTQQAMDRYYPKDFYENFETEKDHNDKRYEKESRYVLKHLSMPKGRKPRILDIGCANGDFPRHMSKHGWDAEGLEIASERQKTDDFKIYNTVLPDLPVCEPTYDAVTAWAVLEHVHDPMAYFKKTSEILLPGGIFAFLVTNVDSLSSNTLCGEDLPRHTYYFNRKTVKQYLELNGLSLLEASDGKDIYRMMPGGWLIHMFNKLQGRPPLKFEDFPPTRGQWFAQNGLESNIINSLKYVLSHPLAALDRITAPLYEQWQIWTKRYGITTYIARKVEL